MFGKIKKILGIESVKLEVLIPEKVNITSLQVVGKLKFTSLSDNQIITGVTITMIEKYTRGRGDSKLINEYEIGKLNRRESITINKQDVVELDFTLPFTYVQSEMDKIGDGNFFARGVIALAKKAKGVHSEFYIQAEATVEGTSLHPFQKVPIKLMRN